MHFLKSFYKVLAASSVGLGLIRFSYLQKINNDQLKTKNNSKNILNSYKQASDVINRFMIINGVPGVSVGVSVNGEERWRTGFGLADVETGAKCTGDSVMRIASISKSITATVAAQLIESGLLDIDRPISDYLKNDFPEKKYNNESVSITTRQLLSHLGGIRHYSKKDCENYKVEEKDEVNEFLSNKKYSNVLESLELFKNDNLVAKPGTKYYYTTHGFTLVSAVLEKASGQSFQALLKQLFIRLGMNQTSIDQNFKIVPNRAKYYKRNSSTNQLENVSEVDNSCKWGGGGLISSVHDLLNFANALLFSYQATSEFQSNTFLQRKTIEKLWNKEAEIPYKLERSRKTSYGLGWQIFESCDKIGGISPYELSGFWFHTGAAVGVSSVLLIKPSTLNLNVNKPNGVCVAILLNCQDLGDRIVNLAREIAEIFEVEILNEKKQNDFKALT